jgi:hypothetical protein
MAIFHVATHVCRWPLLEPVRISLATWLLEIADGMAVSRFAKRVKIVIRITKRAIVRATAMG